MGMFSNRVRGKVMRLTLSRNFKRISRGLLLIMVMLGTGVLTTVDAMTSNPSSQFNPAQVTPIASPTPLAPMGGPAPIGRLDGVNVLFIIDQSGSMSGADDGTPNDLENLRFRGPQYIEDWLRVFLEKVVVTDKPAVNIALMAFGTDVRPILNWIDLTALAGMPDDIRRQELQLQIQADLSDERFRNDTGDLTNLGYTDFRRAFTLAREMVQQAPNPIAGEHYINAVVLLTDGAPCTLDFIARCGDPIFAPDSFQRNHLRNLATFVTENMPGVELYIAAIDPSNEFFSQLQPEWSQVVCRNVSPCIPSDLALTQISGGDELTSHFNRVLVGLMQRVATLESYEVSVPGTVKVKAYRRLLRVNIFKSNSVALPGEIKLFQPDGTLYPFTSRDPDSPIEVFEVLNPVPGTWRIEYTGAPEDIAKATFITDLTPLGGKMTLDTTEPPAMYHNLAFTLAIVDESGAPQEVYADPAYALMVEAVIYDATLLDPSSRSEVARLPMTLLPPPVAGSPQTNSFGGAWIPTDTRQYEIRVDAYYKDPDTGVREYILQNEPMLDGITPLETAIEPNGLTLSTALTGQPVSYTFAINDKATGAKVAWSTSHMGAQVTLKNPTDGSIVQPAQIIPNIAGAVGEIAGVFTPATPGDYIVEIMPVMLDATGVATPLQPVPYTAPLQVLPIHEVGVVISVTPDKDSIESRGPFPKFWRRTPVTITATFLDRFSNTPVPLANVTGGAFIMPKVFAVSGDTEIDLTNDLIMVQPGVYSVTTDDLGMGLLDIQRNFTFRVEAGENRYPAAGYYAWVETSASVEQTQRLALFIPLSIGGLILILGVAVAGSAFMIQRDKRLKEHPVRGKLYLIYHDLTDYTYRNIAWIQLDRFGRNRISLGAKHLDKSIVKLVVTSRSEEEHTNQIFHVEQLVMRHRRKKIKIVPASIKPFSLEPGREKRILPVSGQEDYEYLITNNLDALDFGGSQ